MTYWYIIVTGLVHWTFGPSFCPLTNDFAFIHYFIYLFIYFFEKLHCFHSLGTVHDTNNEITHKTRPVGLINLIVHIRLPFSSLVKWEYIIIIIIIIIYLFIFFCKTCIHVQSPSRWNGNIYSRNCSTVNIDFVRVFVR